MKQKLRILLVEDDASIYRDVQRFLESKGHRVLPHANPAKRFVDNYEDAVELLKESLPDLAILDIEINGDKNGLELGEFIADHYWLPVIYLTSHYEKENRTVAGYQNASGFIPKPLDKLQLELDIDRIAPVAAKLSKRRTLGDFFAVSQFNLSTKTKSETGIRKRLAWDEILFVTTEHAPKNNVLFHLADGTQWMLYESLSALEKKLPPYLVQFNYYQIVNIKHIDRSAKSKYIYYIKNKEFEIKDSFRETALPLIRLFFPSL